MSPRGGGGRDRGANPVDGARRIRRDLVVPELDSSTARLGLDRACSRGGECIRRDRDPVPVLVALRNRVLELERGGSSARHVARLAGFGANADPNLRAVRARGRYPHRLGERGLDRDRRPNRMDLRGPFEGDRSDRGGAVFDRGHATRSGREPRQRVRRHRAVLERALLRRAVGKCHHIPAPHRLGEGEGELGARA